MQHCGACIAHVCTYVHVYSKYICICACTCVLDTTIYIPTYNYKELSSNSSAVVKIVLILHLAQCTSLESKTVQGQTHTASSLPSSTLPQRTTTEPNLDKLSPEEPTTTDKSGGADSHCSLTFLHKYCMQLWTAISILLIHAAAGVSRSHQTVRHTGEQLLLAREQWHYKVKCETDVKIMRNQ